MMTSGSGLLFLGHPVYNWNPHTPLHTVTAHQYDTQPLQMAHFYTFLGGRLNCSYTLPQLSGAASATMRLILTSFISSGELTGQ